jgi:hypothetical protein
MKLLLAIVATLILADIISVASAGNQYTEASVKLDDIMSNALGLAAFRPRVTMMDEQLHITLSTTLMGDYPKPADIRAIFELYYKTVDDTRYAGCLEVVINNLDGIGTVRWYISPNSKDDFDAHPDYVMENLQQLNPGPEGIAGSSAWIYMDPRYVGNKPAGYAS